MKKKCIGVLGSGSWATALVKILSENTLNLNWFIRNPESIEQIKSVGRNPKYLSYVDLNLDKLKISSDINKVIYDSDILIVAIPSPFIESSLISSKKLLSKKLPKKFEKPQIRSRLKVVHMRSQKSHYFTKHSKKDSLIPSLEKLYESYNAVISRMYSFEDESNELDF